MNVNAEYNWENLKERLKDIENTLLGLKTPVSKIVCDKTGLVTDTKVQALTDMVISHQCNLNGKYIGISGAEKRYYELLFYLIFRAYDAADRVLYFADFLEVAEEMKSVYKCREELILRDAELIGRPLSFFDAIRESCKLLTGRILADDYTKEQLEQMKQDYAEKNSLYERKFNERMRVFALDDDAKTAILEKYEDYGIEGYDDYFDALEQRYWDTYAYHDLIPKEDREFYKKENAEEELSDVWSIRQNRYFTIEENEKRKSLKEAWIHSFKNPEMYLNAYREFSELHFCVNIISNTPNLRDAILYILEYNEVNRMGDDEKFDSLYAELNRALRIARRKY